MAESYYRWFEHFANHCDSHQRLLAHFEQNAASLSLDKAKTLLSVGAGNGDLDGPLISRYMPHLEHYIGIEPDKHSITKLAACTDKFPNLKVTLVNDTFQAWSGPDEPIDVVLLVNSVMFIPDKKDAINQMYDWLNPGGTIIFINGHGNSLFTQIVHENLEVRRFYWYNSLKEDLLKGGYDWFEEGDIPCHISTDSLEDDEVLKLYLKYLGSREIAETQVDGLIKEFRARQSGKEILFTQGCLHLTKPDGTTSSKDSAQALGAASIH